MFGILTTLQVTARSWGTWGNQKVHRLKVWSFAAFLFVSAWITARFINMIGLEAFLDTAELFIHRHLPEFPFAAVRQRLMELRRHEPHQPMHEDDVRYFTQFGRQALDEFQGHMIPDQEEEVVVAGAGGDAEEIQDGELLDPEIQAAVQRHEELLMRHEEEAEEPIVSLDELLSDSE